jgi:CBS domain-containing protein
MGEHNVDSADDEQKATAFTRALLEDVRALEQMLEQGLFERGVHRIGAEQEMFLIDRDLRPAPIATEILERIKDPRLTTEVARFNLEANLTPAELRGACFRDLEREIDEVVTIAQAAAEELGADVLLTGILPTLRASDLHLDNMTPKPRYQVMNEALCRSRGAFDIHIRGLDELSMKHDNVMMESCNTSFQVHLQVGPEEFAPLYNIAQAVTAPVLAAAVNSPLLFGRRLWHETRLALFQHAVDARSPAEQARRAPPRVGFGEAWLKASVIEIFREDIARFRVLITKEVEGDPLAALARGEVPDLPALRLHNGTVWRWNRACYGVSDVSDASGRSGASDASSRRAHLRIESRAWPSGPTPLDEVANAAFFLGSVLGGREAFGAIEEQMPFEDAKANLLAAAREGLGAQFKWIGGRAYAAPALILEELLPVARAGLRGAGVDAADIDRYLGVVEARVRSGQTGASWALRSLAATDEPRSREARLQALTAAALAGQKSGEPAHLWPLIGPGQPGEARTSIDDISTVGQLMTTDLFTVRPDDLVDLAASVMDWKQVRHVPVEDEEGRLVGIISHRDLLRVPSGGRSSPSRSSADPVLVRHIMKDAPITVAPTSSTLEAIRTMRHHKVGCLPVIEGGRLVGIVTAHDFLEASASLLEERLKSR